MSSSRRPGALLLHPITMLSAVVLTVLTAGLGYHHGRCALNSRLAAESLRREEEQKERMTKCSEACEKLTFKVLDLSKEINAALADNVLLGNEVAKLSMTAGSDEGSCPAIGGNPAGGGKPASGVGADGDHVAAVRNAVESMRQVYTQFCAATPGCTVLSDASLLQLWSDTTGLSKAGGGGAAE
uniref:Uncharacterized protein n=1 Tax=Trypanosoma congolense (strain IL3000) TaxID=1068625 RepID=G0UUY7_TRYCI|nr:conserved hypothetical protein [Trypanosoma congolense IL3000]